MHGVRSGATPPDRRARRGQTLEHPPPLPGHLASTKFGQTGDELIPGHHRHAGGILEDRDEGTLIEHRQYRDCAVGRVATQPAGAFEHLAEQDLRRLGLDPEPLDEPLEGMPRKPHRTVIALAWRRHRDACSNTP